MDVQIFIVMNGTNFTEKSPENLNDIYFNVYYYGSVFALSCISIVGNILVITTISRHRILRNPENYFLVSLAFSDLLMGCVYPVYNISHLEIAAVLGTLGK